MAINSIIQLDHIIKTFRQSQPFRLRQPFRRPIPFNAVDDVSLEIQPGEVFGLLGRNGAGKTTLIKVMAGLLVADSGQGRVLGYDIYRDHKQIRANVSLVAPTADVGTDNNLTVRQNLEFWAVVYNVDPALREKRIDELLTFLDLKQYEAFWPMSISAGMRQRLAIARSLLVQNPILFLDEPTVKLDTAGAQAVRDFIRRINQEFGITILLTTHLIFEAEALCDRVAIMDQGKIISCDSVYRLRRHLRQYDSCTITCTAVPEPVLAHIRANPNVVRCEQADGKLELAAERLELILFQVLTVLRQHHIDIYRIESYQPTLEEVFVTLLQQEGNV